MDKSAVEEGTELNVRDRKRRSVTRLRPEVEQMFKLTRCGDSMVSVFHPPSCMELNGSDGTTKTMIVSGYDKSLPEEYIQSSLSKHFASCGEITKVYIHPHVDSKIHHKYAFLDITGEDAQEQALQLSGSYVGGHKLLVKPLPVTIRTGKFTPESAVQWSELNEFLRQGPRIDLVHVTGYDPWSSKESVMSALTRVFSSCGEVDSICIPQAKDGPLREKATLHILGEDIAQKARALDGSDMGGWTVNVGNCSVPRDARFDRFYDGWRKPSLTTRD